MFNYLTGINREAKGLRFRIFSAVGRFVKRAGSIFLKLYCDKREFNKRLCLFTLLLKKKQNIG